MFAGLKRPAGLYIIGAGENKNRMDRGNGKVTPLASEHDYARENSTRDVDW